MNFSVALFILVAGIVIGYRLPGPVARLKAWYRSMTYKPALLKPLEANRRKAAKPSARGEQ